MIKDKKRFSFDSVIVHNMNCSEYVFLHNRMYALRSGDSYYVCLDSFLFDGNPVKISVTKSSFDSFLSFEMKFSTLLNLFASLCMKAGELPF